MQLAQRIQRIQPSATLAINAKATELKANGVDVIDLSVGEPDFDTPEFICQAACNAINNAHTRYVPVAGLPALRAAVADKFNRENNLPTTADQVVVSTGAKQAIVNALLALLNPGDEVLIPAPYWVSYPEMTRLADGNPVIVPTSQATQFKMTADQLAAAITPQTKCLILNSPSNPSGMVYSAAEYQAIGEVLVNHPDIWVISDEIYEHIVWSKARFCCFANTCPELAERTITINGVSKGYAMTGWRIGYATGPIEIVKAMSKIQSQMTSCASSISQYAALAALTGDQSFIQTNCDTFKARHDLVQQRLNAINGVESLDTDGAFYAFPNVSGLIEALGLKDDIELCSHWLEKAHVATVPGTAFGMPGHVRISFAASQDVLNQALDRVAGV